MTDVTRLCKNHRESNNVMTKHTCDCNLSLSQFEPQDRDQGILSTSKSIFEEARCVMWQTNRYVFSHIGPLLAFVNYLQHVPAGQHVGHLALCFKVVSRNGVTLFLTP